MNKLPKPIDKLGYNIEQVKKICRDNNLSEELFWNKFGVNTCALAKDGSYRFYQCDVERALYLMGCKLGKFHLWD